MNDIVIKNIQVDKLFGHYTYSLPVKDKNQDVSKLFILYGNNGSGKTTILNLIFYLLSTRDKSGYKSKLAQTKFNKIAITLSNGIEVGAKRNKSIYGDYTYYIKKGRKIINTVDLKTYDGHSIRLEDSSEENKIFKEILRYIRELNISIYFLSEDRKTLSSQKSSDHEDEIDLFLSGSTIEFSRKYETIRAKKRLNEKRLSLELTVERFIDWIRKQVIQTSKTGESNSLQIYNQLINSINTKSDKPPAIEILLEELNKLEDQSNAFFEMGLIDTLDFKKLKTSIKKVNVNNQESLTSVLHLFINSTKARFSEIQSLYVILSDFINAINKFYNNKSISFNLSKGIYLRHESGDPLSLEMLSSGEKQLLLLFINTITATDQATIFIIDEPEISLNIKWQRMLLQTLLRFSENNNVQFIVATHSIELLSTNPNNVVKLEDRGE